VSLDRLARDVTVWVYTRDQIRGSFENIHDRISTAMREHQMEEKHEKPFVLAVTSSYRGEGVTSVATGIAYTISLYDRENVLLVDSNLHHPQIDRVSGVNRPEGLYEISIGNTALGNTHDINRLLQNDTPQIPQLMNTDTYKSLIPSVEKLNYRLIVLDLPCVQEGASATKSASLADGVVLVVESEKVRSEAILRVHDKLEQAGANILGIVLNKRRFYIPRWLYQRV
jgi:Mrp family chromosome partitioning ATPase